MRESSPSEHLEAQDNQREHQERIENGKFWNAVLDKFSENMRSYIDGQFRETASLDKTLREIGVRSTTIVSNFDKVKEELSEKFPSVDLEPVKIDGKQLIEMPMGEFFQYLKDLKKELAKKGPYEVKSESEEPAE